MKTVNDTLGKFKVVIKNPTSEARQKRGKEVIESIVKKPKTRMKKRSQVEKLNRALRGIHGSKTKIQVSKVYVPKSKVVRSSEFLKGVKLSNGQKGWLNVEGKFRTTATYKNLLHSLDSVAIADPGLSLAATFENATPSQQFKIMNLLEQTDWDNFWITWGDSPETGEELMRQDQMYNQIVFDIAEIVGEEGLVRV